MKKNRLNRIEYLKKYLVRFHKSEIEKQTKPKLIKKRIAKNQAKLKKKPIRHYKKNPKNNIVFSF
jgi:hypothetical protein